MIGVYVIISKCMEFRTKYKTNNAERHIYNTETGSRLTERLN